MKVEARLFMFLVVFFAVAGASYYVMSIAVYGHIEPIGLTVFVLSFLMALLIWFYLHTVGRKMTARPEDHKDAEVVDGVGALGFFPPRSIWPFTCALVLGIIVLGPVFGWWLTILGGVLGVWAVCGWCYEYYVGDYQH